MPVSKAQIRAQTKWVKKTYDRLYINAKKGEREVFQAAAEAAGESLNSFCLTAIRERVERMKQEQNGEYPKMRVVNGKSVFY